VPPVAKGLHLEADADRPSESVGAASSFVGGRDPDRLPAGIRRVGEPLGKASLFRAGATCRTSTEHHLQQPDL